MKLMKVVCTILGLLCVGIGALGALLPGLPTVPFLVLAAFFLAKGSQRFEDWFKNTGLYKNHLDSFVKTKGMTLKKKLIILIPVSAWMLIGMYFTPVMWAKIVIGVLIIIKYYFFLFRIKTLPAGKDI